MLYFGTKKEVENFARVLNSIRAFYFTRKRFALFFYQERLFAVFMIKQTLCHLHSWEITEYGW